MRVIMNEIQFLKRQVNYIYIFESTYYNIIALFTNVQMTVPKISTKVIKC